MRLFLAVDIPEAIRQDAERLIARLDIPFSQIRWVKTTNLHITLKFLGETPSEKLGGVIQAARQAAAGFGPMNVDVNGLGIFPNKIKPRIVWLGIKGDVEKMGRLASSLDSGLASLGFENEERPFTPHLTIGRVQSPSVKGQIIRAVTAHRELDLGSYTVKELVLYSSRLQPGGPIYTAVESFPL